MESTVKRKWSGYMYAYKKFICTVCSITLSTFFSKTELVTEVNNIYMFACLNNSPEEKVKQMEKKVNELVEESCFANDRGEFPLVRKPISSRRLNI